MYIYIYICMYIYIYVCIYINMCIYIHMFNMESTYKYTIFTIM